MMSLSFNLFLEREFDLMTMEHARYYSVILDFNQVCNIEVCNIGADNSSRHEGQNIN